MDFTRLQRPSIGWVYLPVKTHVVYIIYQERIRVKMISNNLTIDFFSSGDEVNFIEEFDDVFIAGMLSIGECD